MKTKSHKINFVTQKCLINFAFMIYVKTLIKAKTKIWTILMSFDLFGLEMIEVKGLHNPSMNTIHLDDLFIWPTQIGFTLIVESYVEAYTKK